MALLPGISRQPGGGGRSRSPGCQAPELPQHHSRRARREMDAVTWSRDPARPGAARAPCPACLARDRRVCLQHSGARGLGLPAHSGVDVDAGPLDLRRATRSGASSRAPRCEARRRSRLALRRADASTQGPRRPREELRCVRGEIRFGCSSSPGWSVCLCRIRPRCPRARGRARPYRRCRVPWFDRRSGIDSAISRLRHLRRLL